MTRRFSALIVLACLAGPAAAQTQSYPARTITLTVTAAAGGVTDVVARALGQRLSRELGPAGRDREQGRRRPCAGRAGRGQSDARRLFAAGGGGRDLHGQSAPLRQGQAALRRGEGFCADHRHRAHQPGGARPCCVAGEQRERIDRARQEQAGRPHLRHRRHRLRAAHEHDPVREHGGREAPAHSLPRRGARAHRRHGGTRQPDVGQRQPGAAAASRRQDQDFRHRQHEDGSAPPPISRPSPRAGCRATRPSPGSGCSQPRARRATS